MKKILKSAQEKLKHARKLWEVFWENNADDILYHWRRVLIVLFFLIRVALFAGLIYSLYKYCSVLVELNEINAWEIRLYVGVFLILCALVCFGVLRIYNAVVVNSSFLFKLKTELKTYNIGLKKSTTDYTKSTKELGRVFAPLESAVKSLTELVNKK